MQKCYMRIRLPSGTAAELVHPESGRSKHGLVVIPDVMGLRPLFDHLVYRIAQEQGLSVCAFELYPDGENLRVDERLAAAADLCDNRISDDAFAAARATGAEFTDVIGFCMGGMYVLKSVPAGYFRRHCSFYGMIRVPESWLGVGQREPLDLLRMGEVSSVLAIVGTDDVWTPPDHVDELEDLGAKVIRYKGAEHGFVHDPSRPAHRPDDAADAWVRVLDWLSD